MQPPVGYILFELIRRQLQPTDEEDEAHGAVQDAVLGLDGPAMCGNLCCRLSADISSRAIVYISRGLTGEKVCQHAGDRKRDDEPLTDEEVHQLARIPHRPRLWFVRDIGRGHDLDPPLSSVIHSKYNDHINQKDNKKPKKLWPRRGIPSFHYWQPVAGRGHVSEAGLLPTSRSVVLPMSQAGEKIGIMIVLRLDISMYDIQKPSSRVRLQAQQFCQALGRILDMIQN